MSEKELWASVKVAHGSLKPRVEVQPLRPQPMEDIKTFKVVRRYHGFESLVDIDEDILWALEHELDLPGEFEGTVKVTLEYMLE